MSTPDTRERLIEAATREFAENGIHNASLLEITRQAGQRNRGAVHYHFGSRQGMMLAVLEQYVDFFASRNHDLVAWARSQPADDLRSVVESILRPTSELGETGWRGRCYLMVLAQVLDKRPLPDEIAAVLQKTGGYPVYDLLRERMPEMPEDVREERIALMTTFLLWAVANRSKALETGDLPQLPLDRFRENTINMAHAMLTAPTPTC